MSQSTRNTVFRNVLVCHLSYHRGDLSEHPTNFVHKTIPFRQRFHVVDFFCLNVPPSQTNKKIINTARPRDIDQGPTFGGIRRDISRSSQSDLIRLAPIGLQRGPPTEKGQTENSEVLWSVESHVVCVTKSIPIREFFRSAPERDTTLALEITMATEKILEPFTRPKI